MLLCYNIYMYIDFSKYSIKNQTVAVALSGGSDSMALIHFMKSQSELFGFKVIAVNVEHGIRGKESLSDSEFVENYCKKADIPLIRYSVDAPKKAQTDKLSLEQAARILRYECFADAIKKGKCDKIATAHHLSDNAETVLFNLFRGASLKGVSGIPETNGYVIRPFISVSKDEIADYIAENDIPFVTDSTNFDTEYSRNYIRQIILPEIKKIFPEAEKRISNFSAIAKEEDDFLDSLARSYITYDGDKVFIPVSVSDVVFKRAVIVALQKLGLKKDWESVHAESVCSLKNLQNGKEISLPKNIFAIREYDKVCLSVKPDGKNELYQLPFKEGKTDFLGKTLVVSEKTDDLPLSAGFYADLSKIPENAVFRTRRNGDVFRKFGGGSKKLNDYFTDEKVPLRLRDDIPLLAAENEILVIFGKAVSVSVKTDDSTQKIIKFTEEESL